MEVKLEPEEAPVSDALLKNGFVFVSLDSLTEFENGTNNDEMGSISVKREPCWQDAMCDEIGASEGSDISNGNIQEENKDIASDVNKSHQESLTEASRSELEKVCSFGTAMPTSSLRADVERSSCLEVNENSGDNDFVLGSKNDSHTDEIVYLNGTSTKIKQEVEEPLMKELDPISSNCAAESENMVDIRKADNAVQMKIEIKEETWLDTSSEIPLESSVALDIETDLRNCTSERHEKYQELLLAQKSRSHTETLHPSISTFSINGDSIKIREHSPGSEKAGMYTFHRYNVMEEYDKEKPAEILGPEFPQIRDNFESNSDLASEKKITDEKKPFKCNICSKSFNRAGHLKEHNLFHEGKKLNKCEVCTKSFTRTSDLKKHTLIHKGERVQCKICGKDFSRAAYLKTHAVIHEGKMPHRCKICDKSFTTSSTLKRHSLIHEGKRLYLCKICDKSFTTTSYLKKHSLSHKGISLHKCKICEKSFMWASGLKKHYRIHDAKGIKLEEKDLLMQQDNKNNT